MMRTMVTWEEHRFVSADALATALAAEIVGALASAIGARGAASLVVSGGRTPARLFAALAATPLEWARVFVTLADERWVDEHEAGSNAALVRATLLTGHAARAQFVPLKNEAPRPEDGLTRAWQALTRMPRPFDLVLLGMGDDGHTASLFPRAPGLTAALDPASLPACVAMTAPVTPTARISLNLAALLDTRRLALHIEGEAKWALYQQVRQGALDVPLGAVLRHARVTPAVYWAP